ncbi:hypothetical protein CYY_006058 [Polysphondylium violaceum]|uniref:Peptide chain release factor domain-containing protein n=1 Tax=Polysphondylium violaceum TaxID=133409 RepID=A0A8J4PTA0_9MYCE|nr:hypothetical protein CYY_006058 [Polysphondylium violaceum]
MISRLISKSLSSLSPYQSCSLSSTLFVKRLSKQIKYINSDSDQQFYQQFNPLCYTTTTTTNDNNEISNINSTQEIQFKEKEISRILDLIENSQQFKNNVAQLKRLKSTLDLEGGMIVGNDPSVVKVLKQHNALKADVEEVNKLVNGFKDYRELADMLRRESDNEMESEVNSIVNNLYHQSTELELRSLMNGANDRESAYLEVHAGTGGTDSMDWSEILINMYIKWSQRKGFNATLVDVSMGELAGYKKAIVKIEGPFVYGWLRTEMGVHKLIRISPFHGSGAKSDKRHTSFTSVVVYPMADDSINIEILPKDITIETFKSGGAGGQHVNKTESAVRITHIPTGLVASISDQRSQHQNKQIALDLLKSKLIAREIKKKAEIEKAFRSEMGTNGFGSESIVRTYTMHPTERVKDSRTNSETSQLSSVLDGEDELDQMIKKALAL